MTLDLVFLGPPGAGKGTQARTLAERHTVPHVSTGDLLRRAIQEGTPLGVQSKRSIDAGKLVPDDVVCSIVREMLGSSEARDGFVLDGFPRTLGQAEILEKDLEGLGRGLTAVISFELPDEVVIERLGGRETCSSCGAMYHRKYNPTATSGVCDSCGGDVLTREDDSPEILRKRLEEYRAKTKPLVSWYEQKGLLRRISAERPIDQVQSALERALGDG